jgi:hypothetical protein
MNGLFRVGWQTFIRPSWFFPLRTGMTGMNGLFRVGWQTFIRPSWFFPLRTGMIGMNGLFRVGWHAFIRPSWFFPLRTGMIGMNRFFGVDSQTFIRPSQQSVFSSHLPPKRPLQPRLKQMLRLPRRLPLPGTKTFVIRLYHQTAYFLTRCSFLFVGKNEHPLLTICLWTYFQSGVG